METPPTNPESLSVSNVGLRKGFAMTIGSPAVPAELVHDVLCGARGEESLAVRMPGEAEPRVIERKDSLDVEVRRIEDRDARLGPSVVGDQQVAPVRGPHHVERKIADRRVTPGRRDPPAVGELRDAAAQGAGSSGRGRTLLCNRGQPGGRHDQCDGDCQEHVSSAHAIWYASMTTSAFRSGAAHLGITFPVSRPSSLTA